MVAIRDVAIGDAAAIRAIYAPFVESSPATFETEVPPLAAYEDAITDRRYPWLVADRDGEVLGYARAYEHRPRPAYQWAAETAVYLRESARGTGLGRRLVVELLSVLEQRGFVIAVAAITLPNPASVGLFESLGFTHVGTFEKVGFKLGAWHDVGWWQRRLTVDVDLPPSGPPVFGS